MAVPDFQSLMLPVLKVVAEGGPVSAPDVRARVAEQLGLTASDLAELLPSGRQSTFANRIAWANIFMQPKRYSPANPVGAEEVRDFIGALEGHRASKGVFVTTSTFPQSAHDYVARVSKRVVLIEGVELAALMVAHGVGVRVKTVYEVKELDDDYFSE